MRKTIIILILSVSFLVCALCQEIHAKKKKMFNVFELKPGGKVQLCLAKDMDPDGKDEIITVYKTGTYPQVKLHLKIYKLKNAGIKALWEETSFELNRSFVIIDTGRYFMDAIVFFALTIDGVWVFGIENGKYFEKQIIKRPTIVGLGEKGDITFFDFVRDYNGDGLDEILVPLKTGVSLYRPDKSGKTDKYSQIALLDIAPRYFYRSSYGDNPFWKKYGFRGVFWVEEILLRDFNGDGHNDILFFWEDELDIYYGDGRGFSNERHKKYMLNDLTEEDRDSGNTYVVYFVDDLDENGLPDLIKNKFKGAFTSHISKTKITFRDKPDSIEGKVVEFKERERIWEGGIAKDINSDGKKDFILTSAKFGILSILKAVLKGKIDIKFGFYPFKEGVYYSKDADYSRKVSMGFSLKKAQMRGILPTLDADFNSDGLLDVFYATEDDELRIIFNRKNADFSLHKVRKQKVPVSDKYLIADFDGNGNNDLIFSYKKGTDMKKIRVLLNRIVK